MEAATEVKKGRKAKAPTQADLTAQPVNALALPERAAIALGSAKAETDLLALVEKSKDIVLVNSKDGREQAHRMAMDLQTARTTITKVGKLAREDATAFSAAVLAEERRLIALTSTEETRVFKLRDDYDAIEKAAKAEAERIERERVAAIMDRIQEIRDIPYGLIGKPSAEILAALESLTAMQITEELFGDVLFHGQANVAKADSLRAIQTSHAAAVAAEEQAALVARQAEENRIAAAALEAERVKMAEQQAAQAAEIEKQAKALADQRAADEARAAAEQAETKKQAKEAAEKLADAQQALDLRTKELDDAEAARQKAIADAAAEQAEIERQAALPVEVMETVAEVETAAPAPAAAVMQVYSGDRPASPVDTPVGKILCEIPMDTINDLAAAEAFRLSAIELLKTRTAEEVINLLSDVIADQGE